MRILFDHCVPRPLRRHLSHHEVKTAYEMGWDALKNGQLLDVAQVEFDALLTVDENIPHQQKLQGRNIALVILAVPSNRMDALLPLIPQLLVVLPMIRPGNLYTIEKSESLEG